MPTYDLTGAARMLDATDKAITRIRTNLAGKIPANARDASLAVDKHIAAARHAMNTAIQQAAAIQDDARIYPDGKQKLIGQLVGDTESTIGEHLANARAAADILKADLIQAALPKMSDSRQAAMLARMDAQMILDRTPANRLHTVLQNLAKRNDDVGALITSPWLDDVLLAHGTDPKVTPAMRTLVTESALQAARESTDPDRAKAAEAVTHVGQLAGATSGVTSAWHEVKQELTGERTAARLAALDAARRAAEDRAIDTEPDAA